ncbi:MAG: diguanylate cyclase [Anaerolineales bacterium]|nr:diguanylate cyclase [Anaerolineales bacterium]
MREQRTNLEEVYEDEVFQVLLDYEVARSKRYPADIALMYVEYTPTGSSTALRFASKIFALALNNHTRSADIPSMTKNKFKILMPATGANGLHAICERLISVFKSSFNAKEGGAIAFSINIGGTAHSGGESLTRNEFVQTAEAALHQSKQKGPNTFVISS